MTSFLSSSEVQKVHHVALGFQDSFLITWRDKSGADRIDSSGLPEDLVKFLHARNSQGQTVRNISAIRCVLGPYNASFFAHDSAAYIWMSLPEGLLTALQSRIKNGSWADKPRIVALGADDDFLLITEKDIAIWDLDNYKTVSDMLEAARAETQGIRNLQNIVLHPHRYSCFVAQSKTGALNHANLPPHQRTGITNMIEPVMRDTERLGRRTIQRRDSERQASTPRSQTPLRERARIKREWSENSQKFTAQSKGLKLSLSISIGGLARMLG